MELIYVEIVNYSQNAMESYVYYQFQMSPPLTPNRI
jgi:hypothetical protein